MWLFKKKENENENYQKVKTKDDAGLFQQENIMVQIQYLENSVYILVKLQDIVLKKPNVKILKLITINQKKMKIFHLWEYLMVMEAQASSAANDFMQQYLYQQNTIQKLKQLEKLKDKDREEFLKKMIKLTEEKLKSSGIDYSNSGTCVNCILVYRNMIYICNLGDSRAVLYRETPREKLAIELSYDHKPTRPDEKERIIRQGGRIEKCYQDGQPVGPYRVWVDEDGPGIAITRSLGDLASKKIGITSNPEIQHFELQRTDQFIILATDGLWSVMTSAEACGFIRNYSEQSNAATALSQEARSRWEELNKNKKVHIKINDTPNSKQGIDDITVLVCYILYKDDEKQ